MSDIDKVAKARVAGTSDFTEIGSGLSLLSAAGTFIAAWIYCMQEYGFLFGFGLGWLPAALLAAIVGLAVYYLWAYILGLYAVAIIAALLSHLF
jgi:hypothetical protein